MQTFNVQVYEAPRHADYMNKRDGQGRPVKPPQPKKLKPFPVQARNIDAARKAAKTKLTAQGSRIRSLSIGRDGDLHAVLMHPEDAQADRATP